MGIFFMSIQCNLDVTATNSKVLKVFFLLEDLRNFCEILPLNNLQKKTHFSVIIQKIVERIIFVRVNIFI